MGDFRVTVKLEFRGMGIERKQEMWINYYPDNSEAEGVDQRIIDQFRTWWKEAYAKYHANMMEPEQPEDPEFIEYQRLKKKFEE